MQPERGDEIPRDLLERQRPSVRLVPTARIRHQPHVIGPRGVNVPNLQLVRIRPALDLIVPLPIGERGRVIKLIRKRREVIRRA